MLLLQREEHHVRLEWRFESLVPVHQVGQQGQVGGFERMQARSEEICDAAFIDKGRDLSFAHRQLGAVLDFAIGKGHAPSQFAGLLQPLDDIDKLLANKIKHHGCLPESRALLAAA